MEQREHQIHKGEYIRFGKVIYKIKYISTINKKKVNKSRIKKNKKVTPINLPREESNQNTEGEEEAKMLQESIANNSALAVTVDHDQRSSKNKVKVIFFKDIWNI